MKKKIVLAIVLSIFLIPSMAGSAHAQYFGNLDEEGKTGVGTLEEALWAAHQKVVMAEKYPESGSGTPYLAADGVLGSALITAGIFGGIAATFFVKSRHGRYVAPGRG